MRSAGISDGIEIRPGVHNENGSPGSDSPGASYVLLYFFDGGY